MPNDTRARSLRKLTKPSLHSALQKSQTWRLLSARASRVYDILLQCACRPHWCEDRIEIASDLRRRRITLAEAAGCSVASVTRALGELEAAGLIERRSTGRASIFRVLAPDDIAHLFIAN